MNSVVAIGLMSGTSMDGVDAALIETDGHAFVRPLAFHALPYSDTDRALLRAAMDAALQVERPVVLPVIEEAAQMIDRRHADVVVQLLEREGRDAGTVDVLGYHGQTVAHRPDRGWTWQIGHGDWLSRATGLIVVNDFRSADVAAGGQGAPLVPVYHRALLPDNLRPALVLNLGGVANITFIGSDGALLAFDTGPANALIDDWVRENTGLNYDEGGRIAGAGRADEGVLAHLMDNPWFAVAPPKSLDRHGFSMEAVRHLTVSDGAATLTAFTAQAIAAALTHCPERPCAIHVAGGGRHNAVLMKMISDRCGLPVYPVDQLGWNGDATEAEAFAYLAARVLLGLPTSYPGTTGAAMPVSGGVVHNPERISDSEGALG